MKTIRRLARMSLLWRFALVNLIPILLLGFVLQHDLQARVRERAIAGASHEALAISRSKVEPHLSRTALEQGLTARDARALRRVLARRALKRDVSSVTVWNRSLRIVYAPSPAQINRRIFPISNEHRAVLN